MSSLRRACPRCQSPLPMDSPLALSCPACGEALVQRSRDHGVAGDATLSHRCEDTNAGLPPTQSFASRSYEFLEPSQSHDELGRLGGYRILQELGRGGMGLVFLAEDQRLRRRIALKVMLPDAADDHRARERFLREAQSAASLQHDHVVAIFHVGEDRSVPFIAMPLLQGESLAARLQRVRRLSPHEAAVVGLQVAEGLAAAHEIGLVHRDIKPANIWLEAPRDRVKLLDFGLARSLGDEAQLTRTGAVLGTPAYMAPEQARGQKADERSDLFSLGAVIYRLVTGSQPFQGDDVMSLLTSLAVDTPERPRQCVADVPVEFDDLIMQMLEKSPQQRPASAAEVAGKLRNLASLFPNPAPSGSGPPQSAIDSLPSRSDPTLTLAPAQSSSSPPGRWRLAGWIAALATALLATGVVYNAWNTTPHLTSPPRVGTPSPPARVQELQAAWAEYLNVPVQWKNPQGIVFRLIPPGEFEMGAEPGDHADAAQLEADSIWHKFLQSELPRHRVVISEPFYLGQCEVTQSQWIQAIPDNPSEYRAGKIAGLDADNLPVESMSWDVAAEYCCELNRRAGLPPRQGYRLPSEAEWEYACRAGSASDKWVLRGTPEFAAAAWYGRNSEARPHAVGERSPNAFGLYDMHGNVWEWCREAWEADTYAARADAPATNPAGPSTGSLRIARGGSWDNDAFNCRAAQRLAMDHSASVVGLRVAISLKQARQVLANQ